MESPRGRRRSLEGRGRRHRLRCPERGRGDKTLWLDREFVDFELHVDWRIKEAPYINQNVPYILPDGTHARDIIGKEMKLALPDADSGIYLRGSGTHQVNIWCWPIGSGEMYGIRTDPSTAPELRAAVTPRCQADNPVGAVEPVRDHRPGQHGQDGSQRQGCHPWSQIPDLPARGRLHSSIMAASGMEVGRPPSLVQFKNIFIKELEQAIDPGAGSVSR